MLRITGFYKILFFFLGNYCFPILQKLFILLKIGLRDIKVNPGPKDAQETRGLLSLTAALSENVRGNTWALRTRSSAPVFQETPQEERHRKDGEMGRL